MESARKNEQKKQGKPRRSRKKDPKDAVVRKADLCHEFIGDGKLVFIDGGRRDETNPEDRHKQEENGERQKCLFPFYGAHERVADKKEVHIP